MYRLDYRVIWIGDIEKYIKSEIMYWFWRHLAPTGVWGNFEFIHSTGKPNHDRRYVSNERRYFFETVIVKTSGRLRINKMPLT